MNNTLTLVVMAAGLSSRFDNNIPKPYVFIKNKPILWYSLHIFQNIDYIDKIYVVISSEMREHAEYIKKKYLKKIHKLREFITGGTHRQESVYNALKVINKTDNCKYIGIHDAARAFIKPGIMNKLFDAAVKYGASAPGIPVVDTIKLCSEDKFVIKHLNRSELIGIQTPQVFVYDNLFDAYNKVFNKEEINFSDDSEIYSNIYGKIKIIESNKDLFKITFKEDLDTAKIILKKNRGLWN